MPLEAGAAGGGRDCRPLPGVRVDVWHCDAAGNYSGYARQGSDRALDTRGETFLRGTQFADARRRGAVPDDLARLVPRPHAARPLQGAARRGDGADEPAVLPRRRQRGALPDAAPYRARAAAQDTTTPATASPGAPGRPPSRRSAAARPGCRRRWWSGSIRTAELLNRQNLAVDTALAPRYRSGKLEEVSRRAVGPAVSVSARAEQPGRHHMTISAVTRLRTATGWTAISALYRDLTVALRARLTLLETETGETSREARRPSSSTRRRCRGFSTSRRGLENAAMHGRRGGLNSTSTPHGQKSLRDLLSGLPQGELDAFLEALSPMP